MKPIILILLLFVVGCSFNTEEQKIVDEVDNLQTNEEKRVFLEAIYDADQDIRTERKLMEKKYGSDGDVVLKIYKKMDQIDNINLMKIELFLKKFGHPNINETSKKAALTPWLIVHHSGSIEDRKRNFYFLYNGYKNGDLRPGSFSMYLNRLHTKVFGQRLSLPNPYREEDMIEELIKRLELKD